jgi:hypothetical protein
MIRDQLIEATREAIEACGFFESEADLRNSVATQLGADACETELHIDAFVSPRYPAPEPPPCVRECGDVCKRSRATRRLDLLWTTGNGERAAVEFKYQRARLWRGTYVDGRVLDGKGWADDAGYKFLKDVHRLERMVSVRARAGSVVPDHRFSLLMSNEPYDFEGYGIHDGFCLRARRFPAGHTVEYNERKPNGELTSLVTRWDTYRPFRLGSDCDIAWLDLGDDVSRFTAARGTRIPYPTARLLLVQVTPHGETNEG